MTAAIVSAMVLSMTVPGQASAETPDPRAAMEGWARELGIDRPWDDLPGVSDARKRHRGALAHVRDRLLRGELPADVTERAYGDLARLLALDGRAAVLASKPGFDGYADHFEVDPFRLWQHLLTDIGPGIAWGATLREVYYSGADGAGIPFEVRVPPAVDGLSAYPMVVALGRGPQVDPGAERPFIQVKPSRGGIWGYRSMSAYDVLQVIEFMQHHYPVDADRVLLAGFSAGASGAMHVASAYPDRFAAVMPLVAVGTDYPLANFRNLPVALHHGDEDWTSSVCNARVQVERMRALGLPVEYFEYAGVGHSVPLPHEPLMDWLLARRRERSPLSITHQCETPGLGRADWLHVTELVDPHRRAVVDAALDTAGNRRHLRLQADNVAALRLDLETLPGDAARDVTVEVDGERLKVAAGAERRHLRLVAGRWQQVDEQAAPSQRRRYEAGAAANLYQGEPLLVVYGTGGPHADALRAAAERLALCGGPAPYAMNSGFPVVADTSLTQEQEAGCNLVLVGRPRDHALTRAILPRLPVALDDDVLHAGDLPGLPLDGHVVSLLHPNPRHPRRLVYVVAPFTDAGGHARFAESPAPFLVGSDGFDHVSQADLAVRTLDGRAAREMQFDKGWRWVSVPGAERRIPERYAERETLARTHMRIMRATSGADFALWWGPADQGMWGFDFNPLGAFDPAHYTRADMGTRHRRYDTTTGGVTGEELKQIWDRWGHARELVSEPEVDVEQLDDATVYRLHIPADLYIKLGQRRRALLDPRPGPVVTAEEVTAAIFP